MRPVDADVLRDVFTEILDDSIGAECDGVIQCLSALDSALTVEPEKVCIGKVTFDKDELKEIVQTHVIDKIQSGELILKEERPHGKWVSGTGAASSWLFCSHCDCVRKKEIAPGTTEDIYYPAFCEQCGAEMGKETTHE